MLILTLLIMLLLNLLFTWYIEHDIIEIRKEVKEVGEDSEETKKALKK